MEGTLKKQLYKDLANLCKVERELMDIKAAGVNQIEQDLKLEARKKFFKSHKKEIYDSIIDAFETLVEKQKPYNQEQINFFDKYDKFEIEDLQTFESVKKILEQPPKEKFPLPDFYRQIDGFYDSDRKLPIEYLKPGFTMVNRAHNTLKAAIYRSLCPLSCTDYYREESSVFLVNELIRKTMEAYKISHHTRLQFFFTDNKNNYNDEETVSTATDSIASKSTFADKDFLVRLCASENYQDSLIVMFGQRATSYYEYIRFEESDTHCTLFDSKYYGRIPFVICFIYLGSRLQFFIHFRKNQEKGSKQIGWKTIGPNFNLLSNQDKLKLVFFSLNIARAFHTFSVSQLLSDSFSVPFEIGGIEQYIENRNVQFLIDYNDEMSCLYVRKRILDISEHRSTNIDDLKELYKLLETKNGQEAKIKNSYDWFEYYINGDSMCFYTRLYDSAKFGINNSELNLIQALENIAVALSSLHANGFVHRDVRWDNIFYQSEKSLGGPKFILADFEHSGRVGDKFQYMQDYYPEELDYNDPYLEKHDWYLFGRLIKNAEAKCKVRVVSPTLLSISESLSEMGDESKELVRDNAKRLMDALSHARKELESGHFVMKKYHEEVESQYEDD